MAGPPQPDDHVRVGCAGLPPGMRRQAYFTKLGFLETSETLGSLPKPAVLRKWRREVSPGAEFGLVVGDSDPHEVSLIQSGAGIDAIAEAVAATEASSLLFRSAPSFTPSAANRERLAEFFAEVAAADRFPGTTRVWQPQGLWEPEVAARLCAEMGVVYACDPLGSDPLAPEPEFFASLPGNAAYFRISGLGRPQRPLEDHLLDRLLALTRGYSKVWVVFDSAAKLKDALAFQRRRDSVC